MQSTENTVRKYEEDNTADPVLRMKIMVEKGKCRSALARLIRVPSLDRTGTPVAVVCEYRAFDSLLGVECLIARVLGQRSGKIVRSAKYKGESTEWKIRSAKLRVPRTFRHQIRGTLPKAPSDGVQDIIASLDRESMVAGLVVVPS